MQVRIDLINYFFLLASFVFYNPLFCQSASEIDNSCIVSEGMQLLGIPYQAGILDKGDNEVLSACTDYFDCVTLIEHALAYCLSEKMGGETSQSYIDILREIRYRNGMVNGYASRLHYFTEWILQQEQKGIVRNVTQIAGGIPFKKKINYITSHLHRYPKAKDPADYHVIRGVEEMISKSVMYHIPLSKIPASLKFIQPGDIIAITSKKPGLDIEHTGIIVLENGKIHLLHASSKSGCVLISPNPLNEYVTSIKTFTGIIILRPQVK